jgi:hypothetical protein
MYKIPTAEEFLEKIKNKSTHYADQNYDEERLIKALKEFAELHVQAALKEASEKATTITAWKTKFVGLENVGYKEEVVYEKSILNAYPLKNIK